jgi:CheY-like chemotaxis protein
MKRILHRNLVSFWKASFHIGGTVGTIPASARYPPDPDSPTNKGFQAGSKSSSGSWHVVRNENAMHRVSSRCCVHRNIKERHMEKRYAQLNNIHMQTGIFRGLSIQVLDDNPFYATLLEHQIQLHIREHFEKEADRIRITSYTDYRQYLEELPLSHSLSLIDFYLGSGITGLDLMQSIRDRSSYCKVIIMTNENNLHVLPSCIETGVSGFVFKDDTTVELCDSLIRNAINYSNFH